MSADASELKPPNVPCWTSRLVRSRFFAVCLSVVLHGALFLGFYAMGFARADTRRVIIPEARLASDPSARQHTKHAPPKLTETPRIAPDTAVPAPRLDELPIISVEPAAPDPTDVPASGSPALPAVHATNSVPSPGATAAGGIIGPVSRFFGQVGNAYRIVYVVDVSYSLDRYTDEIIREMQDSIRNLIPSQEFHIVLAVGDEVREFAPRRLVPANAAYKNMAFDFIRSISTPQVGSADVAEAMRCAFAAQPELIYFLTDGDYVDFMSTDEATQTELEAVLNRLNPGKDVRITVIGFGVLPPDKQQPGTRDPPQRKFLQRIAETHGGHCRLVEPE